jgi:hypothetical protein
MILHGHILSTAGDALENLSARHPVPMRLCYFSCIRFPRSSVCTVISVAQDVAANHIINKNTYGKQPYK